MASAPSPLLAEPLGAAADGAGSRSIGRLVTRPRLVRRLRESAAPLIIVQAPGGYGKTALLGQWAAQDEREFAWIGLGDVGDDPASLLDALARQLDGLSAPRVLVLDDAQLLSNSRALALVADVAVRQRPGSAIALATRGEPALPLGRMRVQGTVLELGVDDLALTEQEAATLLRDAGLELDAVGLATLCERSEGWPAGLRLAALAVGDQADVDAAVARFGGDDRFVSDYLRDTVLRTLAPGEIQFLRRSAPLGELSGPLCDAVLERAGSGELLRALARADLLVTALDRGERRFHVHPLLAGMLAAELRRIEPERERRLHRQASAWHERGGDIPLAIHHSLAAGDEARVGELVWSVAGAYATSGRNRELGAWLAQIDDATIAERPSLAMSAAVHAWAAGDRDAAERWLDAAVRTESLGAGLATLHAALARGGAESLLADARGAAELAGDGAWRSTAALLEGAARRLLGPPDAARAALELAARESAVPMPSVRATALALLALGELEEGAADAALPLAEQAVAALSPPALADEPSSALVYAVAASARAQAGEVEQARADADRARRMLAALADPAPWYVAETRVALARALLRLSDAAEARDELSAAGRTLRALPDAPALRDRLDEAWERADSFAIGAVAGPSALTIAELRVLRFLPSHLSFREIAERLHVSANTVKTQAHAVYRKLDASSRSEAVARASLIGLIDG